MRHDWKAYLVYFGVSLAVMAPLFMPGYILTLDLVFTPHIALPDQVTSSYPLHVLLHFLNLLVPSQLLEKLLLLAILLLASVGLHRLVRFIRPLARRDQWGVYIASIFFAINPFTYARFMAGQYNVLLGYALLPWFVAQLLRFGREPNAKQALKLGLLTAVIGVVSVHTLGLVAILASAAFIVATVRHQAARQHIQYSALALGICLVASSYWLVPLLAGEGSTAAAINQFGASDVQAFATNGGNLLAQIGNVLRLQGFWAEGQNLFLLPQDRIVLWGTWALLVIVLAGIGGSYLLKQKRTAAFVLLSGAVVAIIVACGALAPLAEHLPLLAGYREPHKFVGLLALCYAVLLAFGTDITLKRLQGKLPAMYAPAAVVLLLLPFLLTRVMFWGFDGQLTPRQYPADWTTVNQTITKDTDHFSTLFLPWHQYMTFQFSGRIIANPAPQFFTKSTLASTNPELGGATGLGQDQQHQALDDILTKARGKGDLAAQLAEHNIKYILLSKDLDYESYAYLNNEPNIQKLHDYPTLTLYLNRTWRQP